LLRTVGVWPRRPPPPPPPPSRPQPPPLLLPPPRRVPSPLPWPTPRNNTVGAIPFPYPLTSAAIASCAFSFFPPASFVSAAPVALCALLLGTVYGRCDCLVCWCAISPAYFRFFPHLALLPRFLVHTLKIFLTFLSHAEFSKLSHTSVECFYLRRLTTTFCKLGLQFIHSLVPRARYFDVSKVTRGWPISAILPSPHQTATPLPLIFLHIPALPFSPSVCSSLGIRQPLRPPVSAAFPNASVGEVSPAAA